MQLWHATSSRRWPAVRACDNQERPRRRRKEPHAPLLNREEYRGSNGSIHAKPGDSNEGKKNGTLPPLPFISMSNWDNEPLPKTGMGGAQPDTIAANRDHFR